MLFQHQTVPNESGAECSWIRSPSVGPYIRHRSRSIFLSLGGPVAFLGLDCWTERTSNAILSDTTWAKVFVRLRKEIKRGLTEHLIVLSGAVCLLFISQYHAWLTYCVDYGFWRV
jgi:hypothetical protein